jgi:hypothetical protein
LFPTEIPKYDKAFAIQLSSEPEEFEGAEGTCDAEGLLLDEVEIDDNLSSIPLLIPDNAGTPTYDNTIIIAAQVSIVGIKPGLACL